MHDLNLDFDTNYIQITNRFVNKFVWHQHRVQRQAHERSFNDSIEITSRKSSVVPNKKHSIVSETESIGAPIPIRTSSVRFKEFDNDLDEEIFIQREPLPPHLIVKPAPSLKGAKSESRTKLLKTKTSTSATSSGDSTYYRSPVSPRTQGRHLPLKSAQFTSSFSLENVSFSSSPDTSAVDKLSNKKVFTKSKSWSYDDLEAIKRELSEPITTSDKYLSSLMLFDFIPKKTSVIISSPRHLIDDLRLSSMTKEDVLAMWRSSERELLNQLQEALQQKRALEEKVALLQRMLMKPPWVLCCLGHKNFSSHLTIDWLHLKSLFECFTKNNCIHW